MKKVKLVSFSLLSIFLLASCGNNDKETKNSSSTDVKKTEVSATHSSTTSNEKHSSVFKGGKFISNSYDISIDKTELKHNNSSDYDVLVITFTTKNKLNENIVPKDIFEDLFIIKQKDETSEHELFAAMASQNEAAELLFPLYNSEGGLVDDETQSVNEQKQKEFKDTIGNKLDADLLPGKEVQTVILINVENSKYPVTFSLNENLPMKEKEDFVVNLK